MILLGWVFISSLESIVVLRAYHMRHQGFYAHATPNALIGSKQSHLCHYREELRFSVEQRGGRHVQSLLRLTENFFVLTTARGEGIVLQYTHYA